MSTLAVNSNNIDDSIVAVPLADALGVNATLLSLNLTNNAIGDAGAAALGAVLEHNQTLSELDLGNNNIGDAGAVSLAEALIAQSQQLVLTGGECRASTCEDAEEKGSQKTEGTCRRGIHQSAPAPLFVSLGPRSQASGDPLF